MGPKDLIVNTDENEPGGGDTGDSSSKETRFGPNGTPIKRRSERESIIVRFDQPVEGVKVEALTLLRGDGGSVLSPTSRSVKYTWKRSATKRACSAQDCPNPNVVARMQGLGTERRYCSTECFINDWKMLANEQRNAHFYEKYKNDRTTDCEGELFVWPMKPFEENSVWEQIGSKRSYIPTTEDTGRILKIECEAYSHSKVTATGASDRFSIVLPAPPAPIRRTVVRNPSVVSQNNNGFEFRVVTYNILAEIYATSKMYPYCPLWALKWNYRKVQLLKEIQLLNGDIVCLQEVQGNHFQDFLLPELNKLGYDGVYKQKTRGENPDEPGMNTTDGCAVFYRKNRFVLREKTEIEFNSIARTMASNRMFGRNSNNQVSATKKALRYLLRDNVAQVLVLDCINSENENATQTFVMANTHIFWDPEYPEVKLWQTHMLTRELEKFTRSRQLPLILCGDFNSMPDSSVFELLTRESVNPEHPDLEDPASILPHVSNIKHTLNLDSAYTLCQSTEPDFTNYTSSYNGVLDYVFVSKQMVNALSVHEVPSLSSLKVPLPNNRQPSDHVALAADVRLGYTGLAGNNMNGSMGRGMY